MWSNFMCHFVSSNKRWDKFVDFGRRYAYFSKIRDGGRRRLLFARKWMMIFVTISTVSGDCTELYVDSVIKLGLLFHVHHVVLCFVWTNNLLGDWLTCLANDSPKNHQHKSQTVADDSGVDVAEEVVTNCSPTFVVVDFHTPLAWNGTSCQSDGCAK